MQVSDKVKNCKWLIPAIFGIGIAIKYFAVITGKKAISRIDRLAEWDSVFQAWSTGSPANYDPSLVQLLIPNYMLVAKLWHSGIAPLWNAHSGYGMPLLADVQSCAFSILHLPLALWPNMHTYNLILLSQIVIAFTGMFLFCCLVRLRALPAALAALMYSQCPYILYYMELLSGTSSILLPGLFAAFAYAADRGTRLSTAICSLMCAIYVLAGHPESSLFGILFGSILFVFWPINRNYRARLCRLSMIALSSITLAAPMLLPLAEYLKIGDSYKYAGDVSAFAPWQGILLNLLTPCSKNASPFISAFSLWGLGMAIHGLTQMPRIARQITVFLFGMAIASLLLIGRYGFVHELLQLGWLNYLITIYLIPAYLIFLSTTTCIGLQTFLYAMKTRDTCTRAVLVLIACICLPVAVSYWATGNAQMIDTYNFDATLGTLRLDPASLTKQSIIALVTAILLVIFWRKGRPTLICLGLITSLMVASAKSLPMHQAFEFPQAQTIAFLQTHPGRVLSIKDHILKPNYNAVYGIDCVRVHNPLMPPRFTDWVKACGGQLDEFRNQTYRANTLSPAINLSSVKYLATQFETLPSPYQHVFTSKEGIAIYLNPLALPHAYFCNQAVLCETKKAALDYLKQSSFDLSRGVAIETSSCSIDLLTKLQQDLTRKKINQIAEAKNVVNNKSHQIYESNCDAPRLLVVSDTFYPGWKASLDGKPSEIIRANYYFKAILVPAGSHRIELKFAPDTYLLGCSLALASLLGTALLALTGRRN